MIVESGLKQVRCVRRSKRIVVSSTVCDDSTQSSEETLLLKIYQQFAARKPATVGKGCGVV